MKRFLTVLIMLSIAAAIAMPAAVPAYADSDQPTNTKPALSATLTIKAPNVVDAGQAFILTVFSKRDQETIAGASVYALKASDLSTAADNTSYVTLIGRYEALARDRGILLGATGNGGSVTGKLTTTGRYIMVAIKEGYRPGFTRITVSIAAPKGLDIKVPGSAEVNKPLTISIYERFTRQPVEGAAVYAQLTGAISMPLEAATMAGSVKAVPPLPRANVIKADPANVTAAMQYAAAVTDNGTLLGYTDNKGRLTCTFSGAGVYVLVATRADHSPGLARITVRIARQGRLWVNSPGNAGAGENVTFIIMDRSAGQGIEGANLWALRIDDIKGTAESIWEGLSEGSAGNDVVEKYGAWARERGILLGASSSSGEVTYAFREQGRYLLAAVKDGYPPGFNHIKVGQAAQQRLMLKAPGAAAAGQQVTMRVLERAAGKPVEKALVYAFRTKGPVRPAPVPAENVTASQAVVSITDVKGDVDDREADGLLVQSALQPITIGYTDASGEVLYTFTEAGPYVLVASRDDYQPGGARINILAGQPGKALAINVAENVTAGQPSTIKVRERSGGQPIEAAAVYVLKINDPAGIKPLPPVTGGDREQPRGTINSDWAQDRIEKVKKEGVLAGYTDAGGLLTYNFGSHGNYLLAAIKDGFGPGFAYANVGTPAVTWSLDLKAPPEANTGLPVNVATTDQNGAAVGGAAVYSVRMDLLHDVASVLSALPSSDKAVKEKYGALVRARSYLLGYTDTSGNLTFKPANPGLFMLLTVKEGYTPDFVRINIKAAIAPPTTQNTAR